MQAQSSLLHGMIYDRLLCGDAIYTKELRRLLHVASYISLVTMLFPIHLNIVPAPSENTGWRKSTSQSWMNKLSQKLPNWLVQQWITLHWPYWRDKEAGELQLLVGKLNSYLTYRFYLHLLNWQTKHSKLAAKSFQTSDFHWNNWNRYRMLEFVLPHISSNTTSNLQQHWLSNALRSELMLSSASTPSNICRREYTLPVDVIKNQLPSRNKVSFALDRWISTNKLTITLVIAYYIDGN